MVSFSCDRCQDVIKKPKVLAHFARCNTGRVSCVDCGVSFSSISVKEHVGCLTEAQKYEGAPVAAVTSAAFCATCSLALNGAVHAQQHYDSKKHRAAVRRAKQVGHNGRARTGGMGAEEKNSEEEGPISPNIFDAGPLREKKDTPDTSRVEGKRAVKREGVAIAKKRAAEDHSEEESTEGESDIGEREASSRARKKSGVGRLAGVSVAKFIKKRLKEAPQRRLKKRKLRKELQTTLAEAGHNIEKAILKQRIDEAIRAHSRFSLDMAYVRLV
eukprot:CAMPEP_0198365956 /NCGR_PEP_ID=MMETSP1450-20131203/154439_1 /TAXON_ID=753684 ORGANISM="Madagascaria erythrocladiodes, Strain CCMP3234" /NCGR_SAMPLE_ID=MMETSP1450 /ASSEMBLY_ACC=CAM_ASM_001115 /LENGTH=271 /DNA_ID=CAMNT_0044073419 /DNA_START=628 /DNA_END=1443 /DNA_ORIENTATION=+